MPTLTQLSYVVAVDDHRHFGKAAKASHVSQPTLSMQIQKLEEELGTAVFDRSKQPIVLTAKGAEIVRQARRVLSEMRRLETIAAGEKDGPKGEFRLGVIPTLAPYLIPLVVGPFTRRYPRVRLLIDEMKTEDILEALEKDRIDAGLLVTPLHQKSIRERVLFYEPFFVFVSPGHPLHAKTRVRERELSDEGVWLLGEGHCFRNQVVKLCGSRAYRRGQGAEASEGGARFESGEVETLKRLVRFGGGYTLVPYLSVAGERDPELRKMTRPFAAPVPSREVSLVHRRDDLQAEILECLEKVVLEVVPKELPRDPAKAHIVEIGI